MYEKKKIEVILKSLCVDLSVGHTLLSHSCLGKKIIVMVDVD